MKINGMMFKRFRNMLADGRAGGQDTLASAGHTPKGQDVVFRGRFRGRDRRFPDHVTPLPCSRFFPTVT